MTRPPRTHRPRRRADGGKSRRAVGAFGALCTTWWCRSDQPPISPMSRPVSTSRRRVSRVRVDRWPWRRRCRLRQSSAAAAPISGAMTAMPMSSPIRRVCAHRARRCRSQRESSVKASSGNRCALRAADPVRPLRDKTVRCDPILYSTRYSSPSARRKVSIRLMACASLSLRNAGDDPGQQAPIVAGRVKALARVAHQPMHVIVPRRDQLVVKLVAPGNWPSVAELAATVA